MGKIWKKRGEQGKLSQCKSSPEKIKNKTVLSPKSLEHRTSIIFINKIYRRINNLAISTPHFSVLTLRLK